MTDAVAIIAMGLALGMRHATDADHVVAVATIVARQQRSAAAAAIGVLWGIGHTITILLVGGGIILFQWVVPPRLGLGMECAVGAMLVWLGFSALRTPHEHPAPKTMRPLAVGLVHGLAGSAAIALLILTTIREPRWAMAYLVVFGLGTLIGMAVVTMVIAAPFRSVRTTSPRAHSTLRMASGALSVAFGLFVLYDMGIVHGLLSGNPTWTPH